MKSDVKRQRTLSTPGSLSRSEAGSSDEEGQDATSNKGTKKTPRGAAARSQKEKEQREQREKERAEAANKRKGRADRRRPDGGFLRSFSSKQRINKLQMQNRSSPKSRQSKLRATPKHLPPMKRPPKLPFPLQHRCHRNVEGRGLVLGEVEEIITQPPRITIRGRPQWTRK